MKSKIAHVTFGSILLLGFIFGILDTYLIKVIPYELRKYSFTSFTAIGGVVGLIIVAVCCDFSKSKKGRALFFKDFVTAVFFIAFTFIFKLFIENFDLVSSFVSGLFKGKYESIFQALFFIFEFLFMTVILPFILIFNPETRLVNVTSLSDKYLFAVGIVIIVVAVIKVVMFWASNKAVTSDDVDGYDLVTIDLDTNVEVGRKSVSAETVALKQNILKSVVVFLFYSGFSLIFIPMYCIKLFIDGLKN